jgi:hypothetical protein
MATPERPDGPDHMTAIAENDDAVRAAWDELRRARPILEEARRIEEAIADQRRRRDEQR